MGVSVSLLLSAGSISFVGAVCFAAGYLLSAHSIRAPNHSDDDDDDDNENLKKRSIKGAQRLLFYIQDVVRGKAGDKRNTDAMKVVAQKSKYKKPTLLEIESLAEILQDFKMVLVVRNDLKMGKGKIAAQCSHATLGLYKKLHNRAPKTLNRWEMCGQVKVVLRIESEEDMLVLQERAKSLKLPTHITIDAGRTQIAPNSRTVMAILGPADVVDDVTGGLKLL
ncbi:peptidyl-tRNA hydrolase 2, mitochondrial-like [Phalaenopsis equestris]|uniref:peptidyl-tRNA hydrolase 2, mitochondrial-like n=1 Tax=Phalaenopsis equestris TaxID=78828 RepID=UPI0009E56985|nr:peptidyl-tRNA hydrolase 2, mitochondrial-like [Phalaenopsis equestris]